MQKYQFDVYNMGMAIPINATKALGTSRYEFSQDGQSYWVSDSCPMKDTEYSEYIADPQKYNWEKIICRLANGSLKTENLKNSMMEFLKFGAFSAKNYDMQVNEFSCPIHASTNYGIPTDAFCVIYRGIKNLSIDMRRHKSELKEALDLYNKANHDAAIAGLHNTDPNAGADLSIALMSHSLMSNKQFEEFVWRYLKPVLDEVVKLDKTCILYIEGATLPQADFYKELPKEHFMIHFEMDNIYELRKTLPNVALRGGLTVDMLQNHTEKECVDFTKNLIDTIGDGFMLSTNKITTFKNDARSENLLAVNNFVREYIH